MWWTWPWCNVNLPGHIGTHMINISVIISFQVFIWSYGKIGCEEFRRGIQNYKDFGPKVKFPYFVGCESKCNELELCSVEYFWLVQTSHFWMIRIVQLKVPAHSYKTYTLRDKPKKFDLDLHIFFKNSGKVQVF